MRKPILISLICALAALALLFWGMNPEAAPPISVERHFVLLIERDTGAFLMQLRKGMQEAAAMENARLSVQIVAGDQETQAAELTSQGFTAAILLLDDPQPMLSALQENSLPALVVGQTVRGQVCVASDDSKAGEALLTRALSLAAPSRILLFTDESDSRSRERATGASETARRNQVEIQPWTANMPLPQDASVIIALGSAVTRHLADAKQAGALPAGCLVLGTDTGEDRVTDLENNLVAAMTLDNPYAMGYVAIEKALSLAGDELGPSLHLCAAPIIHRSNMYLSENVKLVFPLLQ